jgi:hypothetical protein
LVAARQEFRRLVAAIVDEGFVQAAEGRARIGGHVLDPQRLQHVHHVVRPAAIGGQRIGGRRRLALGCGELQGQGRSRLAGETAWPRNRRRRHPGADARRRGTGEDAAAPDFRRV